MREGKFFLLAAILVVCALSSCSKKDAGAGTATTADNASLTVRISTVQMPQQQMGRGIMFLENELKNRFGDRITIKTFPSAQLYSGAEEIEALGRGEIDISMIVGGTAEVITAKFSLIKLPFLFPTVQSGYDFFASDASKEMIQPLTDRGLKLVGVFSSGNMVFANNKKTIKLPSDFVGLKLRTPGKMDSMSCEALGAVAIVTPSEETYSAIQQGVIDGMLTPDSVFFDRKYYEIQKYVTDVGLFSLGCGYILMNSKYLNSLSANDQALMLDAIKVTELHMREEIASLKTALLKQMVEQGCTVYTLSDAERAEWVKATSTVYPQMETTIGANLIKAAREVVAKSMQAN
jgi:C4-dicarboxylate-binding protein DctP